MEEEKGQKMESISGIMGRVEKKYDFIISSRRQHTRFLNVTEVQTCALPI